MKVAIVIIDMLQDFFEEGYLKYKKDIIVKNVNELTKMGRRNHIPIIWVRQEFKEDLSDAPLYNKKTGKKITIEWTEWANFLWELIRENTDFEIMKKRYSAFFKTNLKYILDKLESDTLIIAWVNTMSCVRMSAIDAYQYDYKVIVGLDCIEAYDFEQHESTLKYLRHSIAELKTNNEIQDFLKQS